MEGGRKAQGKAADASPSLEKGHQNRPEGGQTSHGKGVMEQTPRLQGLEGIREGEISGSPSMGSVRPLDLGFGSPPKEGPETCCKLAVGWDARLENQLSTWYCLGNSKRSGHPDSGL